MKKYLMSGVAALAFAAAFTSCSKSTDLYDGPKTEEPKPTNPTTNPEVVEAEIQAAYEAAFINTFGKPAADQDWGFGDDEAATRAFTRASVSFDYYKFPADADESKFLAEVPDGVEKLTANNGSVNGWIDDTWNGELNIWGADINGKTYNILPLAHPRQIGALGAHSEKWYIFHQVWEANQR